MLEGVENKIMGAKTRIYAYYCVPLAPPVSNQVKRLMASCELRPVSLASDLSFLAVTIFNRRSALYLIVVYGGLRGEYNTVALLNDFGSRPLSITENGTDR